VSIYLSPYVIVTLVSAFKSVYPKGVAMTFVVCWLPKLSFKAQLQQRGEWRTQWCVHAYMSSGHRTGLRAPQGVNFTARLTPSADLLMYVCQQAEGRVANPMHAALRTIERASLTPVRYVIYPCITTVV
jgi:hypothetical protein